MDKKRRRPRIGITIGDIGGIGPELVIRAYQDSRLKDLATPILYGSTRVINIYRKVLEVDRFSYNVVERPDQAANGKFSIIDVISDMERVDVGKASKQGGKVAVLALQKAVEDLKNGQIDVLVTLPIDKATIQSDEFDFPGHTEFLAQSFEKEESLMFMTSEDLKVGVVTGHVPLKEVAENISSEGILRKIRMMNESLKKDFRIVRPRIAVLGLNPHAGDNGLLGKEDKEKIRRAVEKAGNEKILAVGPYPADGFFASNTQSKFDGVLAMYHDQGLIPFKIIAGFRGVNYTAGLPFVRTSPDHGVAYDLAGKSIASTTSLLESIFLALDIHRNRQESETITDGAMKKRDSRQIMRELKKEKDAQARAKRQKQAEEQKIRQERERKRAEEEKAKKEAEAAKAAKEKAAEVVEEEAAPEVAEVVKEEAVPEVAEKVKEEVTEAAEKTKPAKKAPKGPKKGKKQANSKKQPEEQKAPEEAQEDIKKEEE